MTWRRKSVTSEVAEPPTSEPTLISGFEGSSISDNFYGDTSTVEYDTEIFYEGAQSAKFPNMTSGTILTIDEYSGLDRLFRVYCQMGPSSYNYAGMTVSSVNNNLDYDIDISSGYNVFRADVTKDGNYSEPIDTGVSIPPGVWLALEIEIQSNDTMVFRLKEGDNIKKEETLSETTELLDVVQVGILGGRDNDQTARYFDQMEYEEL